MSKVEAGQAVVPPARVLAFVAKGAVTGQCAGEDEHGRRECGGAVVCSAKLPDGFWQQYCEAHVPFGTEVQIEDDQGEKARDERRFWFVDPQQPSAPLEWDFLHRFWIPGLPLTASRIPDIFGLGYNTMSALMRDLREGTKEPNDYLKARMAEGAKNEAYAIQRFLTRHAPKNTGFMHSDVMKMFVDPGAPLAATPDLAFCQDAEWRLVEVKCPANIDTEMDTYWKYIIQLIVQLGCTRIGNTYPVNGYVYVWDGHRDVVVAVQYWQNAYASIRRMVIEFLTLFQRRLTDRAIKKAMKLKTRVPELREQLFSCCYLKHSDVGAIEWISAGRRRLMHTPPQPTTSAELNEPLQKARRTDSPPPPAST